MPDRPFLSETIGDVHQLDANLSEPTPELVEAFGRLDGDVLVLGVAGKMGPTLSRMAHLASDEAGSSRKIVGVARFSDPASRLWLEQNGVETIQGDLLDPKFVDSLPDAPNVVYAAGMKFGSTGNEPLTWAVNTYLPALVCRRYPKSRIVAFSTGNVYGVTAMSRGGSVETDVPCPLGEYAMSCLGRERMFEHFSRVQGTPVAIVRLNYATELRYGVLVDVAKKVYEGQPLDVSMGYANVIWQSDANAMTLALLEATTSPANFVNLTGPETLSIRSLGERFGVHFQRPANFVGAEKPDALLSNAKKCYGLVGRPRVDIDQMIRWTAAWVGRGGASLGKPTHFEVRDGKF